MPAPRNPNRFASAVRAGLAAALATQIFLVACSSSSSSEPGRGVGGTGGSGALCGEVPICSRNDDPACPSIFPLCRGAQCCADYVGCLECGCDEHCPASRPWCTLGVCGECASNANCPRERPCCEKVPFPVPITGGRYTCIPIDGDRCKS